MIYDGLPNANAQLPEAITRQELILGLENLDLQADEIKSVTITAHEVKVVRYKMWTENGWTKARYLNANGQGYRTETVVIPVADPDPGMEDSE